MPQLIELPLKNITVAAIYCFPRKKLTFLSTSYASHEKIDGCHGSKSLWSGDARRRLSLRSLRCCHLAPWHFLGAKYSTIDALQLIIMAEPEIYAFEKA